MNMKKRLMVGWKKIIKENGGKNYQNVLCSCMKLSKNKLNKSELDLTRHPPSCSLASTVPESTTQAAKGGKQ